MGARHRKYNEVDIKIIVDGKEIQIFPDNVEAFVFLLSQGRARALELSRPHVDLLDDSSVALVAKVEKSVDIVRVIQTTIGRARNAVCALHPGSVSGKIKKAANQG